ncbi:MAG TPA: peptide chain release factor N(5)-glutamine methyltransferase [Bacteroidales bacterium]|nr:peptide chain release factor N(5)-glutamine methyltransferase [Bacteroidales bacterium]HNS45934.1 peptide chain release factor N(5)-glutamine methyltransferase [Bacteroidales bacterium]
MVPNRTVGQVIALMKQQLDDIYEIRELNSIVDLILGDYLGQPRITFRSDPDLSVSGEVVSRVQRAIHQLKQHVPVQYILGKAHFYELDFIVNEQVLIPRQETGELVKWILDDHSAADNAHFVKILDIGTGSGCIAIALKRNIPDSMIAALDISQQALDIARLNAQTLKSDVQFVQTDILNPDQWDFPSSFDVIVSNPPYVLQSDKAWMGLNVLDHEPALALFVEDERPLIFYEAIVSFALRYLSPGGNIYLEVNERMGSQVCGLFRSAGYQETILRRDIHDKIRMIRVGGREGTVRG